MGDLALLALVATEATIPLHFLNDKFEWKRTEAEEEVYLAEKISATSQHKHVSHMAETLHVMKVVAHRELFALVYKLHLCARQFHKNRKGLYPTHVRHLPFQLDGIDGTVEVSYSALEKALLKYGIGSKKLVKGNTVLTGTQRSKWHWPLEALICLEFRPSTLTQNESGTLMWKYIAEEEYGIAEEEEIMKLRMTNIASKIKALKKQYSDKHAQARQRVGLKQSKALPKAWVKPSGQTVEDPCGQLEALEDDDLGGRISKEKKIMKKKKKKRLREEEEEEEEDKQKGPTTQRNSTRDIEEEASQQGKAKSANVVDAPQKIATRRAPKRASAISKATLSKNAGRKLFPNLELGRQALQPAKNNLMSSIISSTTAATEPMHSIMDKFRDVRELKHTLLVEQIEDMIEEMKKVNPTWSPEELRQAAHRKQLDEINVTFFPLPMTFLESFKDACRRHDRGEPKPSLPKPDLESYRNHVQALFKFHHAIFSDIKEDLSLDLNGEDRQMLTLAKAEELIEYFERHSVDGQCVIIPLSAVGEGGKLEPVKNKSKKEKIHITSEDVFHLKVVVDMMKNNAMYVNSQWLTEGMDVHQPAHIMNVRPRPNGELGFEVFLVPKGQKPHFDFRFPVTCNFLVDKGLPKFFISMLSSGKKNRLWFWRGTAKLMKAIWEKYEEQLLAGTMVTITKEWLQLHVDGPWAPVLLTWDDEVYPVWDGYALHAGAPGEPLPSFNVMQPSTVPEKGVNKADHHQLEGWDYASRQHRYYLPKGCEALMKTSDDQSYSGTFSLEKYQMHPSLDLDALRGLIIPNSVYESKF